VWFKDLNRIYILSYDFFLGIGNGFEERTELNVGSLGENPKGISINQDSVEFIWNSGASFARFGDGGSQALSSPMVMRVKSRQVTEFPLPWDESSSPYALNQFTPSVRSLSELASQDQMNRLSSSSASKASVSTRLAKAVFVGDVGVGKTSIINRFCRDIFQLEYKATIGVDYEMERFWILNVPTNLQM